eukprot:scaffold2521_cov82-Skeletonema_dohrnii-CCMP3373.AAC.3
MQQYEDRVSKSKREQLEYHESYNLNFIDIDIRAQDQLRRNATCSGTLKQRRRRLGRAAVVPSYSAISESVSVYSSRLLHTPPRWVLERIIPTKLSSRLLSLVGIMRSNKTRTSYYIVGSSAFLSCPVTVAAVDSPLIARYLI